MSGDERPVPAAVLGALLRLPTGAEPGDAAQRRAVAAFRAARDAGAHRARPRPGDDWRPRSR